MKSPLLLASICAVASFTMSGCSTAPKSSDQAAFRAESDAALSWFTSRVPGLRSQIANSAGYAIFPEVGQWGIIFGGGKFGRGLVAEEGGRQIGWGAVNTGSVGLQAGVQGFKMLLVFQDDATFNQFQANKLTGSVGGVAVIADSGAATTASFTNGVATYEGAQTGLMAGVNIALDYVRFVPFGEDD